MRIRFSIVLGDLQAYQESIRSSVSGFAIIRCMQSIGGPAYLLYFLWAYTHWQYGLVPTLFGALPGLYLGYYLWKESPGLWVKTDLKRLYEEGKLSGHLGDHTLELRPDGIVERNAAGECFERWSEIDTVYSTDRHTFFVSKAEGAFVLPRYSIVEGDYAPFVESAHALWRAHHG